MQVFQSAEGKTSQRRSDLKTLIDTINYILFLHKKERPAHRYGPFSSISVFTTSDTRQTSSHPVSRN